MRHLMAAVLALTVMAPVMVSAQSDTDAPEDGIASGPEGSASELFFTVEELREEVRRLRGSIEEVTHRLDEFKRRSRERYVDLDQRLVDLSNRVSELEGGDDASDSGSSQQNGDSTASGDGKDSGSKQGDGGADYRQPDEAESKAYASIQYLIQEKKDYEAAIDEIYEFIDKYPEGDLTINAYYWLGELYLSLESYEQARQAFTIVTSKHGEHRKAPDALFKLAVAHDRAGNSDRAAEILDQLSSRYPDSRSAALGREYRMERKKEPSS